MENQDLSSQNTKRELIKTIVTVIFCILINYAGRKAANSYSLPLWMDAFGTVLAAYILGPWSGAIVGAAGNIIFSIEDPNALIYAITSFSIGLSVGFLARKGYLKTFFHSMSVAGCVTMVSVAISATLNLLFFEGSTGNLWGDGVRDYLVENGFPPMIGTVIGELYLDFLDKTVALVSLYLGIRFYHSYKSHTGRKQQAEAVLKMVLIGLLVLGNSDRVFAAQEMEDLRTSYIQKVFNRENGLQCGHANDIAQTNDGILWIGTYAGLYRYNGTEFKLMQEYDAVRTVNCLYADEEGRLWIGTNDNGLVIAINDKVGNVMNTSDGLPSDSVRCIAQCSDGEYYIGTSDSMMVFSLKMGLEASDSLTDVRYATGLSADPEGHVAAVTSDGTLYLIKNREVTESLRLPENRTFTAVCFGEDGRLLAGTSDGHMLIYTVDQDHLKKKSELDCAPIGFINRICGTEDGGFCLCSDNGIGYLGSDSSFGKIETGEFNSGVQNMLTDYQGNIWFASSRHGLLRMSRSPVTDLYAEAGLERSVVNTTALWNHCLYIGTDTGLDLIRLADHAALENDLTAELQDIRVRCIRRDAQNHLWICTYGLGLIEVEPSGNYHAYATEEGVGTKVRTCTPLSDGRIAVGGSEGLCLIENQRVTTCIPYGEDLGFAQILCILEQGDGSLLVGTDGNGIATVRDGAVEKRITSDDGLSSNVVMRIVPDTISDSYFVVTSNGLCYMGKYGANSITNFPYYNNYDVCLDADGEMFVLGSAGIYVLKRDALMNGEKPEYRVFSTEKGLSGSLTANSWNDTDEEKNIYLSTDSGVFILNMDAYTMDRTSYRIMVPNAYLDDEAVKLERGSKLTVPRETNKIEFLPEIVNYTLEEPIVSYYLEGQEKTAKTVPQNELSRIVYTNLSAGTYIFHLAIVDRDTGDIFEESTYTIEKEKQIQDNRWFRIYMVVVALIFIAWLSWFITRTQIQRTLELQQSKLKYALQEVQMGNETILAIAKTVDAKDVRTSKHSQRVSEYAVLIARELGFDESQLENLRKAALLHDIGKIGIPDSVLNKPDKLTDEEYAIMKTHVTKGAEILKDFTLVDHVVEGARYHHERFDGRGYPDGLKGEEIPLYGRIIAIADTFDAMTANRVYRKKLAFDYVLEELKRCRGTQFDPHLLDLFLKVIDDGKIDIAALYAEDSEEGEDANV